MFESKQRKSINPRSVTSKSNSKSKFPKKQLIEIIYTDTTGLKTHKSKSLSREKLPAKKSIDVSKITKKVLSQKTPSRSVKLKENQLERFDQYKHKKNIFYDNLVTEKAAELKWGKKSSLSKIKDSHSAEKYRKAWDQSALPFTPQHMLTHYLHLLTKYEQKEIKQFKKIYYAGHNAKRRQKFEYNESNFDNEEKQYNFVLHDHIGYRYQILGLIGKGSYGQVLTVYDHKKKEELALKMIKNRQKFTKQAFVQIEILTRIKEQDPQNCSNIIKIRDFVIFRRHVCLLFQKMSQNLYELIIRNNYNGLSLDLIRRFAIQILAALQFLRKQRIIHCDLKPENILLKEYHRSGIKLIDLGSSCFQKETIYTYIQSRYYRAPEITLGLEYDCKIDIWSTGCILGELYTGVPLFPGQNEFEQMKYFCDTLGTPPLGMIEEGSRSEVFFQGGAKSLKNEIKNLKTIDFFSKSLEQRIPDQNFRQFLQGFLKWDPKSRTTPKQALKTKWIRDGIPEHLRDDDMFYKGVMREQQGAKSSCKTTRVTNTYNSISNSQVQRTSQSKSREKKLKMSVHSIKGNRIQKY